MADRADSAADKLSEQDAQHQEAGGPLGPTPPKEVDGARDKLTLGRLLDPAEGPQLLRKDYHEIVGAFHAEWAALKHDASVAEQEVTRSAALKKVEDWLGREEKRL